MSSLIGYTQSNREWKLNIAVDNFIEVSLIDNEEVIQGSIVIKNSKNTPVSVKPFVLNGNEKRGFSFPKDFDVLETIDTILNQKLYLEIREKRNIQYQTSFYYDPSPNSTLQLLSYHPQEKLQKKLVWGDFIDGYQWEDKNGENIVIRSALAHPVQGDSTTKYNKYLYLYHYRVEEDSFKLVRKFTDSYKECDEKFGTNFTLPSIELTDIDRDTIGEINTIYELKPNENDTAIFTAKLLLTTEGEKYMYYATVDPCAIENRVVLTPGSFNLELRPFYARFMRTKLLNFYK